MSRWPLSDSYVVFLRCCPSDLLDILITFLPSLYRPRVASENLTDISSTKQFRVDLDWNSLSTATLASLDRRGFHAVAYRKVSTITKTQKQEQPQHRYLSSQPPPSSRIDRLHPMTYISPNRIFPGLLRLDLALVLVIYPPLSFSSAVGSPLYRVVWWIRWLDCSGRCYGPCSCRLRNVSLTLSPFHHLPRDAPGEIEHGTERRRHGFPDTAALKPMIEILDELYIFTNANTL